VCRTIQEGTIMSYTVASPAGKSRPATVTAASALLFVCAAIEVASLVLSLIQIGPVTSVLKDEFANAPGADTAQLGATWGAIGGAVIAALFAIGNVVLAMLVRSGKNPARIVTWVLGGIAVLCYGCTLGGTALTSSLNGMASTPETEAMQKRMLEVVPGWARAASVTATVILLIAFLGVIILLALPASNAFFRKEQEVWVPPTYPGGGTGGFPPAPPSVPPFTPPSAPPPIAP
jgi:uncharacterized protein YraI